MSPNHHVGDQRNHYKISSAPTTPGGAHRGRHYRQCSDSTPLNLVKKPPCVPSLKLDMASFDFNNTPTPGGQSSSQASSARISGTEIVDHSKSRDFQRKFRKYQRLHNEVTELRVRAQQSRSAASRARKQVAKEQSAIAQALHQSEYPASQVEPMHYQNLLASADQARNVLGPLEQELDDLEFRLVSKEDRLLKESRSVQDVMSKYPQGLPKPRLASPSDLSRNANDSEASSQAYQFEDDSPIDESYYDPEAQHESDYIDQFAPDLGFSQPRLRPSTPDRPEEIELYVDESSRTKDGNANIKELVESQLRPCPSSSHLPPCHMSAAPHGSLYDELSASMYYHRELLNIGGNGHNIDVVLPWRLAIVKPARFFD